MPATTSPGEVPTLVGRTVRAAGEAGYAPFALDDQVVPRQGGLRAGVTEAEMEQKIRRGLISRAFSYS